MRTSEFDIFLNHRIQKINQPFGSSIIMEVYHPPLRQQLLFSTHSRYPRILSTQKNFANPPVPPLFCLWLRTRLIGAIWTNHRVLHSQAIAFEFLKQDTSFFLVWEDNGKHSNLLLLDQNQELLIAQHNPNQPGRTLSQGHLYQLPSQWHPPSPTVHWQGDFLEKDLYFWNLELQGSLSEHKTPYRKHFKSLKKKLIRRLEKQEEDLLHCHQAETYQQWGELLKSHLHEMALGQKSINVINYFDVSSPVITIPLNSLLVPKDNMSAFFHKAQKLKKAIPHVNNRISQTKEEFHRLDQELAHMEDMDSVEKFHVWSERLPRFLKINLPQETSAKAPSLSGPLTRLSSDGCVILVGRNAQQNHEVTFSMARGNDWWFHAQGVPGSHVIVKWPKPSLTVQTLQEAAQLAAYYSKARDFQKIEVDYTQRKYIKKIKGGLPGQVTFTQNKSICITPDSLMIQRILDRFVP